MRTSIVIVLVAGILSIWVRWYFVTHAVVLQPLYIKAGWGDAAQYYRYAWNLVHHGLYSSDLPGITNPKADAFRDPAYSVFLALIMSLTDNYDQWMDAVIRSQAVIGGVAVTCALLAIRHTLPTWLFAIAAIAMTFWPHLVAMPAFVLTETLTAFFFAGMALALTEAVRRRSTILTVLGGILLALAALTNGVLGPLFVVIALAFAWKGLLPRRQLILFAVVALLPLLGWGIRNSTVPGPFSSSFRAEVNLVQGSWPTYHAASQLAIRGDPVGVQTIAAIDREIEILRIRPALGLQVIAERIARSPGTYATWYLSKPTLLWGWEIALGSGDIYAYPTRQSPFIVNPLMRAIEAVTYIFNGIMAIFALAGIILVAVQRAPSTAMLIFAITTVWITAVYGVLQSDARYAIPFRTAEIALACVAARAAATYIRLRIDENRKVA